MFFLSIIISRFCKITPPYMQKIVKTFGCYCFFSYICFLYNNKFARDMIKLYDIRAKYICTALLLMLAISVQAQQMTISNNLLYDATLTPNLRLGVSLSPHWSMGLTAGYRPWPTSDDVTRKWRHLLLAPDVRYWRDSLQVGHFFGADVIYSHYNVADVNLLIYGGDKKQRREGDMVALGAFYGYSWELGRRWTLEALVGLAVGYAWYDIYDCGRCGNKLGDECKIFLLPQLGLNIVYHIPIRKRENNYLTRLYKPVEQTWNEQNQ